MAKTQHIDKPSNLDLSTTGKELFGIPTKEVKERDYTALAATLQQKGELRLLHGDRGGLAYFDMAIKLDPSNSALLIKQGLSLFEYGSHEGGKDGLTLASKRFKQATTLNPHSFEGWHLWGNTLYFLGKQENNPSYFSNALKKYEKAISLSDGQPSDVLADLFWDFGDLWSQLATQSGEVTDLHYAVKAYERATTYQDDLPPEFWVGLGKVYTEMGNKTNETRFFIKGVDAFKNAISIRIAFPEGWLMLGKVLKTLYLVTHEEDHFLQANECFSTAVHLSGKNDQITLEWGRLLLESGALFRDVKKLRAAIDKCRLAHSYNRKEMAIITTWVEALSILGIVTQRLEPIHEALNKIEPLTKKLQTPDVHYAHGVCFSALGQYYKDIDYHYQAIETFQEGLSLDRTDGRLWHAIAMSSFSSSILDHDETSYERSLHFFEQALHFKKSSTIHSHFAMCLLKYGELTQDQKILEHSVYHFEEAISMQKNAPYLHPDWMFQYASALNLLAGFLESDHHFVKAIEILSHLLMSLPEFPNIHFQLALTYSHYAELIHEPEIYLRAIHYYRIAYQKDKENDQVMLEWALTLVNLGDLLENEVESDQYFREAEYKMIQAAKLGNVHAYYALACLYSVIGDLNNSMRFLKKAKAFDALPPLEEIQEDDWLDNLKETEPFHQFISELETYS
ncbi:MAG: hypothetical protein KDK76_07710 [Chlamydiia bacterium]|nr:hypothetical protein [Chlamydiia bacterium]